MKATLSLQWQFLAFPFAAVGVAIVVLFVWAFVAVSGFEPTGTDGGWNWQGASVPVPAAAFQNRAPVSSAHRRFVPARMQQPLSADERMAASANLLDFVESIRNDPVPGGHYLALKAYDFCTREARLTLDAMRDGRNADEVSATNADSNQAHTADSRQVAAQSRLAQLCGTFRNHQLLALDYYLLAEEGLRTHDPRMVMSRRMERLSAQWDSSSRDDSTSRQMLIADVLSSADGTLVRDLASELEVILHSGQMLIGGQVVPQSENADVIDALRLIACEQGAACTRDNEWHQLLACASAGECAPEPWITQVGANGGALRWRNRIREALLSTPSGVDVIPVAEQRY